MNEETLGTGPGGTRSALLDAATSLLESDGIDAVTLRAVGERAGVSRQAPYRHFADKSELLAVMAIRYFKRLEEQMVEAAHAAGDDASARLIAMSDTYVRFGLENPSRYRMIFALKTQGTRHEDMQTAARALHERIVQAMVDCQEAGQLPAGDPVELAALLYVTGHGAIDLALSGHAEEEKGLADPFVLIRQLVAHLRRD